VVSKGAQKIIRNHARFVHDNPPQLLIAYEKIVDVAVAQF
jgi:hypothetical protein